MASEQVPVASERVPIRSELVPIGSELVPRRSDSRRSLLKIEENLFNATEPECTLPVAMESPVRVPQSYREKERNVRQT